MRLYAHGCINHHKTSGGNDRDAPGDAVRMASGRYRVSLDPDVGEWTGWVDVGKFENRNVWLPVSLPFIEKLLLPENSVSDGDAEIR